MGTQTGVLIVLAAVAIAGLAALASQTPRDESDREQVLEHIHGIFRAYLRQDRAAIRRSHTADWTGFQGPSTGIERGLDAYMKNADRSLEQFQGTGYELLDTEVQLYGDIALVYYVADYHFRNRKTGETGTIPLRALDVYRREADGWNQSGSHITPIPSRPSWTPDDPNGER
jgi:ketosteroid isomerase-like protein